MIVLFSLSAQAADNWDLLRDLQVQQATISQPVLLGTTDAETRNAVEFIQRVDPNLKIEPQQLPVIGDVDAEVNRALAQKKLSCAIVVRIENDDWLLTQYGECTQNINEVLFHEDDDGWAVKRGETPVSVIEWAVTTRDEDLQELLLQEQKNQLTTQRGLLVGSAIVATSSLTPLLGIQPGSGSATEDRLWTSGFLIASAVMLYQASKFPAKRVAETQSDLSNYVSKPYAKTTVKALFGSEQIDDSPDVAIDNGPPSESGPTETSTQTVQLETEKAANIDAEESELSPPAVELDGENPPDVQTGSEEPSQDQPPTPNPRNDSEESP